MRIAISLVVFGFLAIVAGFTLFSPALGLISAGLLAAWAGLYFDFEE